MNLRTFIFIGASGSGKGTQAKLLQEELKWRDPDTEVFYFQSGDHFRSFVKGESYAAKISRRAQETGERQPDFLAMWIWSDVFIRELKGNEHIIIDGSPRSLNEAQNLDIAMKFFNRELPDVIHFHVSREWSKEHLLMRAQKEKRVDDTVESIEKRLDWYDRDVLPAINYYRRDRHYNFHEIDGSRSIDEVHQNLISRVFFENK